jgi:hypothetical protein
MAKLPKKNVEQPQPMNNNVFNSVLIPLFIVKLIAETAYQAGYEGDLDSKSPDCLRIIQEILEESGANIVSLMSEPPKPTGKNKVIQEMEEILGNIQQAPI